MSIFRTRNNTLPPYYMGRPRDAYLERLRRRHTAPRVSTRHRSIFER